MTYDVLTPYWPRVMAAAQSTDGYRAVFPILGELVQKLIGTGLLTCSVYDMQARQSRRIYTENAAAYPGGGYKPLSEGAWAEQVLERHEIYATLSIAEISEIFFDWELIRSLGFDSNANIPVVVAGKVIGTLNLLDQTGYYTAERLAAAPLLMPVASIAFLLAERSNPFAQADLT